ncbi:hypothetical protein O3G_MSEX012099 [Manduca sexta]|uniref:Regulatory protein zeste n=1 Tax=Manduca sexta TaxID=7130 RepID=A0A922CWL7_MANSE|nr:hypothetical protein O3G_MSEX012099 [Manduca sexta]KAG6460611.1 hypothetical protein O3G_MSEX012099 [Manduca sexta]
MNQASKKRQRGENWLEEDKIKLTELVRQRVSVLENKNTDTNSNVRKVAAWNSLRESFNLICKGSPRTVTQLKAQWGILKMKAKRTKPEETKELFDTGGSTPPMKQEVSSKDINSWLPNDIVIGTNEFDSDSINQDKSSEHSISTHTNDNIIIEEITVVEPPKPSPVALDEQPKKQTKIKKKVPKICRTPAEQIAHFEIQCRKELHSIQMANERQKNKNLVLKEMLLKKKIKYFISKNDEY